MEILFLLIAGHFLCDYPLQGDFIGKFKNRHVNDKMNPPFIPWWHLMTAHAFIQAGMVVVITDNILMGMIELVIHFITDCLKCEGWINIHVDQTIHILTKLGLFYAYTNYLL